ncbi:hypothetical protein HPB52_023120 [Rhipicephalus sanguineus]|uniref:Uncharacterized protein n=1 Tax=Rhipicephalus sanguineus TaxID=34632 RepID=A0A9D4PKW0_RHISA|nr:hypothetical protein HPB52_023120 [Rhipicephalus sanguineus]
MGSKPHPRTTSVSPTAPFAADRTPPPTRTASASFKFRTSCDNDGADVVNVAVAAPGDRAEPALATPTPPRAPPRHQGEAAPSHRQRDVAAPSTAAPTPGDAPPPARPG